MSGPGAAPHGRLERQPWLSGTWLNQPQSRVEGTDLVVTTAKGSDLWRTTYYGFTRDTGHALLFPLLPGQACEVTVHVELEQLYDQAGILVRAADDAWVKAGVELSDGEPQLGAVVTDRHSDWSCCPVPEWSGRDVVLRASWTREALLVRAKVVGGSWRLVRLAPFAAVGPVTAGIYCASPERSGLSVRFRSLAVGPADHALHL